MLSKQSKISCHRQAKLQQQTEEKYKKNLKDMCTRGKEKKKEFSKIFRSLNGPQLPPAQKITRGGQNNTSVTSVKTRLIKHARNHSINHNIVPPLYGHQDRIEEVIAESMTGGQKRPASFATTKKLDVPLGCPLLFLAGAPVFWVLKESNSDLACDAPIHLVLYASWLAPRSFLPMYAIVACHMGAAVEGGCKSLSGGCGAILRSTPLLR
ncbi:hypothetical protein ABBQ38_006581 [Trebouxia sp. C0009 RCD-2024]